MEKINFYFSMNLFHRHLGTFPIHSIVTQSCPTLRPHESQHTRPPCPSPTPGAYPNSCPLNRWCHPTISSSVVPFSCPQSFPASRVFSNESALCIRWPKYWMNFNSLIFKNCIFFITYRPSTCLIPFTRCFIGVEYKKSCSSKALHEWQFLEKLLMNFYNIASGFYVLVFWPVRHVGS